MEVGEGFHTIYTSASAPGLITDVLYFSADYIAKKPKVIDSIIKGYIDGMKFMSEHPDEAYAIVAKYFSTSVDDVKEQAKGVYNVPVAEMAGYFAPRDDAKSLYTSGKLISEILIKRDQIKAAPKIEDTFDPPFVAGPHRDALKPQARAVAVRPRVHSNTSNGSGEKPRWMPLSKRSRSASTSNSPRTTSNTCSRATSICTASRRARWCRSRTSTA